MKTAISIPDDTFDQVSHYAKDLGVSRSEFFTRAVRRYLRELEDQTLTRQINDALAASGQDDVTEDVVAAGHRTLAQGDEDW